MGTFVLRFKGRGSKPAADLAQIRGLSRLKVLDDSSPRMLLVEAPEGDLQGLMASMPDWVVARYRTFSLPSPQPRTENE